MGRVYYSQLVGGQVHRGGAGGRSRWPEPAPAAGPGFGYRPRNR